MVLADIAWTLSVGRSHFAHRAGTLFHDAESLRNNLPELEVRDDLAPQAPLTTRKAAFAYTGQSSQWPGMGRELYVLAVKSNEPLGVDTENGSTQVAARRLSQQIPDDQWERLSAGEGSKGPRLYDWGRVLIRPWAESGERLSTIFGIC